MEIAIVGMGTANPKFKKAQLETAELICETLQLEPAEKRLLRAVYKATGIENRYSVLSDYSKSSEEVEFFPRDLSLPYPSTAARMQVYKKNALQLSLAAIKNCFSSLPEFDKSEITHIITVSCTGMYAPGVDVEIVQYLRLNSTLERTAINFMGCYGAFNALKVAHAACQAKPNAKVLIVCIEICTIHFQKKMSMDNIISNSIFADGAAAVLVQANPRVNKYFSLGAFYCDLLPQTHQEMAWVIADSGFDIVLSSYVPDAIQQGIATFFQKLLIQCHFTFEDINLFAIHPGGVKILQACEKALNITAEQNKYSYNILRHYGNMSSATVLFVLKAIWDDLSVIGNNQNIFSCAFGPGLTLESMLLKIRS